VQEGSWWADPWREIAEMGGRSAAPMGGPEFSCWQRREGATAGRGLRGVWRWQNGGSRHV
jgi:hypothetical protein